MFKPPPRQIKARDRRVLVKCPICRTTTVRTARNQVYCSKRCRKKAEPGTRNKTLYDPLIDFGGEGCSKKQTNSSRYGPPNFAISGPRSVIETEIIDAREWTETVSRDGVVSFVSILRPRALRSGGGA
jgi:hypothetical protein